MSAPGSQGYTEIGNGVEGREPEAGGSTSSANSLGTVRAEELHCALPRCLAFSVVIEISYHTPLRGECGELTWETEA